MPSPTSVGKETEQTAVPTVAVLLRGARSVIPAEQIVGERGDAVGILGILGVSVNYFIYQKILAKGKQKYGSDLIALANEIAKE